MSALSECTTVDCSYCQSPRKKQAITRLQQMALRRKWRQDNQGLSYLAFRRSVQQGYDCIMVKWCGMWLGIESDGYTHS